MSQEVARVYSRRPSAFRGWLKRIGGIITFNRRVSNEGKNEVADARAYRQYERDTGRGHRSQSRHRRDGYGVDRSRRSERSQPFLHSPYRCRPTYHGAHFRLWGFLTRRKEHIARGMSMAEEAERERRRERRRRRRQLQAEGLAIRMGAKTVVRGEHSHRHRHRSRSHHDSGRRHHSHRDGFTPIITTADVGQGAVAYPVTTAQAIPVARSASAHTRHRHHSSNGTTVPLVRTSSSRHGHQRSYSGTTMPIVPVANSHYTNGAGAPVTVAVSRAASSRHGHEHYDTGERAIPVMRSSSRHGSSRYGDPALSRPSSSRHDYRRSRSHGHHSRTATEMYVSA